MYATLLKDRARPYVRAISEAEPRFRALQPFAGLLIYCATFSSSRNKQDASDLYRY
jgi:hypothetical protein